MVPSAPNPSGSPAGTPWDGALGELPPITPEVLERPSGARLTLGLSADPTGLEAFRRLVAGGGRPRAALAMGPGAALDAFGATAHHLGVPALGFAAGPLRGSAVLAFGAPDPDFAVRLAEGELPPIPDAETPADGAPPEGIEALIRHLREVARAPEAVEVAQRLDGTVGGAAWFAPGAAEAALLREDPDRAGAGPALALALEAAGGGSDPFWAAAAAVAAVARRLACVGAEPLGLGVRLGDPGPGGADRMDAICMGLRQACLSLGLPLAEVRVASEGPTLILAGVGSLEDCLGPVEVEAPDAKGLALAGARCAGRRARRAFDGLFLLGALPEPGAEGLALDLELRLQACVREGIRLGLIRSAAAVGPGGLVGTALQVVGDLGVQLLLPGEGPWSEVLGSPAPGRLLVTAGGEGEGALRTLGATHGVPLAKVGVVGGGRFSLALAGDPVADLDL